MSTKPFDVTLKDLIEEDAAACAALAGYPDARRVTLTDADVSTVTAAADKVLRVESDEGECLVDLEPESRHAADLPDRLHLYATVLHHRHRLPVRGVALLLRREANASNLTGVLETYLPGETTPYDVFRYKVIRVWELPLAPLLGGGLGTLPLAPLTDEGAAHLPGVLARIGERLRAEASPERADKLWMATYLLFGLRDEAEGADPVFQGVRGMEESRTYQAILRKGRAEGERKVLLRQGRVKFGPPDEATVAALNGITDPLRLEQLSERLLTASSWQELLTPPGP